MNAGGIFEFAPRAYLGSLGRNCNASLALSCVFSSLALHSSSAAGGHVHEFEGDLREVRRPCCGAQLVLHQLPCGFSPRGLSSHLTCCHCSLPVAPGREPLRASPA